MDRQRFSRIAYSTHIFYNPLSEAKLDRVLDLVPLTADSRVVDFGTGRCEALIRLVERYSCSALAVETDEKFLETARNEAMIRIPGRVLRLVHQEATKFLDANPACNFDMALCIGASHAFGDYRHTLARLKACVRPGGWLLVGKGYWKQKPSPEYLLVLGGDESELTSHEGNIRTAEELGLVPLWASVASDDEWDEYEWRYRMNIEAFAHDNPDDPDREAMLEQIHAWNHAYLAWGRATFGFGLYLFRNA
jgi:SAM-dependent methyltransferase